MNQAPNSRQLAKSPITYEITVTLLEDLHAGSGFGGAGVDALVMRDRLGQPVVRWSHLKGLLKDALSERAEALQTNKEATSALIAALFGAEDAGGRGRGGFIGTGLHRRSSTAGSTFLVSSTGREKGRRTPQHDTLRHVEFVRAGTRLQGLLQIQPNAVGGALGEDDAEAWLKRLTKRVDRLGGKRGRGSGRVQLKLERRSQPELQPALDDPELQAGEALTVVFRMLAPVCLSATPVPGNVIASHSHASSGAASGSLVAALLASNADDLAEMVMRGDVVAGPGYPAPPSRSTETGSTEAALDALPVPLNFLSPKPAGQGSRLPWWVSEKSAIESAIERWPNDEANDSSPGPKLKRPDPDAYLSRSGEGKWSKAVMTPTPVQRNDIGSALRGRGKLSLYSVEELPEDTLFVVHVGGQAAALGAVRDRLRRFMAEGRWLRLGHGGSPFVIEQLATRSAPQDIECASTEAPYQVRLLLESDLILRIEGQRFHDRLSRGAVERLLALAGLDQVIQALAEVDDVSEPCVVRGWNAQSGQPRVPVLAIRRGSVAKLTFNSHESAGKVRSQLAARGATGLGDRTDEGYGRLRTEYPAAGDVEPEATPAINPVEAPALERQLRRALPLMEAVDAAGLLFKASRWQSLRELAGCTDANERTRRWAAWVQAARWDDKVEMVGKSLRQQIATLLATVEGAGVIHLMASRLARRANRHAREAERNSPVQTTPDGGSA